MSFSPPDPIRLLIRRRLDEKNITMKTASCAIGRNGTYIQQYLTRSIPAYLGEIERVKLAQLLDLEPAQLMSLELRQKIDQLESGAKVPSRVAEPQATPLDDLPSRDPLLDQIMGLAYSAWFQNPQRDRLPLDKLPGIVYLCHDRLKAEGNIPPPADIARRLQDMIAVLLLS